jgi:hypothetical protein
VEALVAEPPAVLELICCCANKREVTTREQTAKVIDLFMCKFKKF